MKLRHSGGGESASPLERVAIVLASLTLSIGVIALTSGFFGAHDQAGVSGAQGQPGQAFPDQGHVHLRPGELRPVYDSDPPTSGAHVPVPVTHDDAELSDDQLLQALELGNVVLIHGGPAAVPALRAFAHSVAAPFSPALAAAGQAVILARRPHSDGVIALAWTRMLHLRSASDPLLHEFAQFWLGRGAAGGP